MYLFKNKTYHYEKWLFKKLEKVVLGVKKETKLYIGAFYNWKVS